ncbi:MAG: hypothetical protein J6T60_14225 [Bacteroidales bacterium]|nr:hypothetical protein [Bacteroidales bacterium]
MKKTIFLLMILFLCVNNAFAQNVSDMAKTGFQDNNFHTESCPDSSYYILSQVRDLNVIPQDILNLLDSMGIDDAPVLNHYESSFLNVVFKDSSLGFDFTNKEIGFINNGTRGKVEYFDMVKQHHIHENSPFDVGTLYIFNETHKKESTGYDAAIVYWWKRILPPKKVARLLNR